ncbi:MAG TPA: DNA repair protein RadC [Anaerolineales bacterium]|nr:DNA repair protein RadC [Anaerolineales bacterium]
MVEEKGSYRIADLAPDERPRERLKKVGPGALNTAELLAVLLRTGLRGESAVTLGQRLLNTFGGLTGLQRADYAEVESLKGMGEAKATAVKAAIEIGQRLSVQSPESRPAISSPADAAALVQYEMSGLAQEHLRELILDTRNRVVDIEELYKGSINFTSARIAEIFKPAIVRESAAIILVHNHPSGDPTPSPDDLALTKAVREAGQLLDIELLDHLIIGQGRYISMKERKLGFG